MDERCHVRENAVERPSLDRGNRQSRYVKANFESRTDRAGPFARPARNQLSVWSWFGRSEPNETCANGASRPTPNLGPESGPRIWVPKPDQRGPTTLQPPSWWQGRSRVAVPFRPINTVTVSVMQVAEFSQLGKGCARPLSFLTSM